MMNALPIHVRRISGLSRTTRSLPGGKRRRLAAGLAAMALTATLAACSSDGDAADAGADPTEEGGIELTEIVVNYETTAVFVTLKLAQENGIFEKHGLDVELLSGGPGSSAMSSLLNGQIHVAPAALASALLAADEGLPIVVASNLNNDAQGDLGSTYATVAAPGTGIEIFADLEGKTVAVNSTTCCWVEFTRAVVDAQGGDSSSIEFLPVPFPNQVQAMRDGQVDAATTVQPFISLATNLGGAVLGATSSLAVGVEEPPGAVAVMSREFASENPGAVEAWQAAMAEASQYATDNPDELRALIARETGMEQELVDQMQLPTYTATFSRDAYDATVEFMDSYGVFSGELPSAEELLAPGVTGGN